MQYRRGMWRYWVFLAISVVSLGLIASTALWMIRRPDEGFVWSLAGEVVQVEPRGPGAKAGLQVGDVIVMFDGSPIHVAPTLYPGKNSGDVVDLKLLRGDETYHIQVVLRASSLMVILRRLEPLFIALSFWLVSVVPLFLKPTSTEGTWFSLCSQATAGVLAVGKLSSYAVPWSLNAFNILLCIDAVLLFYFHLSFPVARWSVVPKWALRIFAGICLLLALPYVFMDPLHLRTLAWHLPWRSGVRLALVLSALASVGLLMQAYATIESAQVRRQVRLIVLGTASAFMPIIFLTMLPQMFWGSWLVSYDITFLGLALIPAAYAVAIYRQNLLGIDRFLNRSLAHFALGLVWVACYLLLTAALNWVLPEAVRARPLLGALVTLFITLVLVSWQRKVQRWVDRLFYGGWYDYRSVIAGVSVALNEAQDEAVLTRQLVHRVAEAMDLRGAALFLASELDDLALRDQTGFGHLAEGRNKLPGRGALARLLRRAAPVLETAEIERQLAGEVLTDSEQAWLKTKDIRLWLPLVFKEELRGVLLLGRKRRDEFFDAEDMRILETLAHQAALAAENVRLLDSLRGRIEELSLLQEELKATYHRLLSSREEERFHLARELHDRLLQELFALNVGVHAVAGASKEVLVVERLTAIRQDMLRLAEDTRRICAELRPPVLSIMGLADAIRSFTEEQARRWKNVRVIGGFSDVTPEENLPALTITLDLDRDRKLLPDDVAIVFYRVYQEALNNVAKHAQARNVWVREELTEGGVSLYIRDDGQGFQLPDHLGQFARQGHFGLVGAQERMAAVGGKMQVTAEPGVGTEIAAWVSLQGAQDASVEEDRSWRQESR